jgi:predicted GH43/DUF377 family glycosyl hydrolase
MFRWQKVGKLFEPADLVGGASWMQEYAQSPSTLIFDDRLRVYFCSRPTPQQPGQYISHLAHIDLDRSDLRKIIAVCQQPALALGEFGTFDEFGTNPVSVIRDRADVRVYYAGWSRCESVPFNAAIGVAVSRDNGDSFQRIGAGPVLSYTPDEPYLLGSPRVRRFGDCWYLWYVAGRSWLRTEAKPEPVYKIRMATSDDGIRWRKVGRDLLPDVLGEHECQACADVTFASGRFHMFFSYRQAQNYKRSAGGYRMGYAVSDDLLHWRRRDELAGLEVSAAGWDSQMVSYPHVFMLDDQHYMLYQGNEMGRSGFGLARLEDAGAWSAT